MEEKETIQKVLEKGGFVLWKNCVVSYSGGYYQVREMNNLVKLPMLKNQVQLSTFFGLIGYGNIRYKGISLKLALSSLVDNMD